MDARGLAQGLRARIEALMQAETMRATAAIASERLALARIRMSLGVARRNASMAREKAARSPSETAIRKEIGALVRAGWVVVDNGLALPNWETVIEGIGFRGEIGITADGAAVLESGGPIDPTTGEVIEEVASHFYAGGMAPSSICLGSADMKFARAMSSGRIGLAAALVRSVMESAPGGEQRPYHPLAYFKMIVRCRGFKDAPCGRMYSVYNAPMCLTCGSNGRDGLFDGSLSQGNTRSRPSAARSSATRPTPHNDLPPRISLGDVYVGITRGMLRAIGLTGPCEACQREMYEIDAVHWTESVVIVSPRTGRLGYCRPCSLVAYHCERPDCFRLFASTTRRNWSEYSRAAIVCDVCIADPNVAEMCMFCHRLMESDLATSIGPETRVCSVSCVTDELMNIAASDPSIIERLIRRPAAPNAEPLAEADDDDLSSLETTIDEVAEDEVSDGSGTEAVSS